MTLPAIPHVLHITDIQYYHTVYYAYIFNIGFSTRLYIFFFHIVNKYFKKKPQMSITPSPCGYIVTTKLNCSLEKGKKKSLFVTMELMKALITAMFCFGVFFCQMRCLSAITILVLPSTCSCISWLLCIIYQSNYQHSLSVHRG